MDARELDVPRPPRATAGRSGAAPARWRRRRRWRGREIRLRGFNSVGLNLYRDRNDSVAPHNDRLGDLVPGHRSCCCRWAPPGACASRTRLTAKLELDLEPGSLLLMDYESQKHYDHGIPKQRAAVGPRISLAFRMRRALKPVGRSRGRSAESGDARRPTIVILSEECAKFRGKLVRRAEGNTKLIDPGA
jgi:hypothetical protein